MVCGWILSGQASLSLSLSLSLTHTHTHTHPYTYSRNGAELLGGGAARPCLLGPFLRRVPR